MATKDISRSSDDYTPISNKALTMTREQGEKFERRQSEPPRQPTPAERAMVRMFHQTVKR
jgi:hypothetical protein